MALLVTLALVAVLASAPAAGPPQTALTITVWPAGPGSAPRTWTLTCGPVGGTLPRAAIACKRLAALRRPFRPVPPDIVCIELYGGPQTALVRGRRGSQRVWARLSREDGCQIARWNRVRFLLPVPVGTS